RSGRVEHRASRSANRCGSLPRGGSSIALSSRRCTADTLDRIARRRLAGCGHGLAHDEVALVLRGEVLKQPLGFVGPKRLPAPLRLGNERVWLAVDTRRRQQHVAPDAADVYAGRDLLYAAVK